MSHYIVVPLSETHSSGATHAGLVQAPKIGGDWLFDLLVEESENEYTVVQPDCTAPAGEDVDSLSEICGSPVGSTFARDVNAALFPES